MTEASTDRSACGGPTRKRRYERGAPDGPYALTPQRLAALRQVSEWGLATAAQVAAVAGLSEKGARRALRANFDAGLVDVIPVPRCALAPGQDNGAHLLFGSAPNVYRATRAGLRLLWDLGIEAPERDLPRFGPRNSLFLAHELAVRDVRVWADVACRNALGCTLEDWRDGAAAEIPLGRSEPPKLARPDAWFVLRAGERRLIALVEADRNTEPVGRWKDKVATYRMLFASGRLREVTGFRNARVLCVAPSTRRRDWIARTVQQHAAAGLAERFWVAGEPDLGGRDLTASAWVRPGTQELLPLLRPEDFASTDSGCVDVTQEKGD